MGKLCQMILLVIMTAILHSCGRTEAEAYLDKAGAVMDQDPDSAFAILTTFDSIPLVSENDSARYALLYNLAKYKQFDDSLDLCAVKSASEYFVDHGDDRNAMMSLFLLGRIQTLQQQYGPAAVSLLEAIERAQRTGDKLYEGQIYTGLFLLYECILDASHQVYYADKALQAFKFAGDKEWILDARLGLACGYNNNRQYDLAIALADSLYNESIANKDNIMAAKALLIKAKSSFDNPPVALTYYLQALKIDQELLESEWTAISDLLADCKSDSISKEIKELRQKIGLKDSISLSFKELALSGNYQDAYLQLMEYREQQDYFIEQLLKYNIGESVEEHQANQALLKSRQRDNERKLWIIGILMLVICSVSVIMWLKAKLKTQDLQRQQFINIADELAAVLSGKDLQNQKLKESVRELFGHKCATLNHLCETYYESNDKKIVLEVKKLINDISNDGESLERLESFFNHYGNGIISDFRRDFSNLKGESHILFLYYVAGFGPRAISILQNVSVEVVYNRKSRLKKVIQDSMALRKSEYLEFLH